MIKSPITPNFYDAMQDFKWQIFYNLYCHLPGSIVSYDRVNQTAVVQPGLQRVLPSLVGNLGYTLANYKPVVDVPVYIMQGGGVSIGADPVPGDPCMLCVIDRNMDAWILNGGTPAPLSDRAHDLSDCFALVGFNPTSKPLVSARLAGEVGIAEPLTGTGAKVVVKNGKISIASNAQNLLIILQTLIAGIQGATAGGNPIVDATGNIATALTDLVALLY